MRISNLPGQISESKTLAITALAARMRAEGREVISLSAGEPDFATPAVIRQAGIRAIEEGWTRYTPAAGKPEVRQAAAESLQRDFGLQYKAEEICITAGTKPAIYQSLLVLLNPGDKVLIFAPYWVSYPDLVHMASGVPVIQKTEEKNGFLPTKEELEKVFAEHDLRCVILNSPCNPTGAAWPPELLETLVQLCLAKETWILSDEIYGQILYGNTLHVSPAEIRGGRKLTVVLNGLSKAYSMTGWRLGYLAAPKEVTQAVAKIQSQMIGNPCTISQGAALEALGKDHSKERGEMLAAFQERRRFLLDRLPSIEGFSLRAPAGAFYMFPGIQPLLDRKGWDDEGFCMEALEELGVALVPGSAFGFPGHIRLSFAASMEDLKMAVDLLQAWTRTFGGGGTPKR
ncbi:MAG TPA: pyridoxal phosphate-dependent aminotransferase [Planctomycetes bacterium]|nr:pyridoxal phosphate-dependent aminotransferase [Planctomycetota bacterium]